MSKAVKDAIARNVDGYVEYAEWLAESNFVSKIPGRSNKIGEQLWCVIGGHESAVRAVENGKWMGFECSLSEVDAKDKVVGALRESGEQLKDAFADEPWSTIQEQMAIFVVEHDAMHQGQLIRFDYALDLGFPQSWKDRWYLTD